MEKWRVVKGEELDTQRMRYGVKKGEELRELGRS